MDLTEFNLFRLRRALLSGSLAATVTTACTLRIHNSIDEPSVHRIPVYLSTYPLVFAPVLVQGQAAQALVDTGSAAAVRISTRLAKRLGVDLSPVRGAFAQGLDGQRMAILRGQLEQLALGSLATGPVEVEVTGERIESISAQVGTAFDVVLGWSFLAQYHFVLDYRTRLLQLSGSPLPPAAVPGVPFVFPFVVVQRLPVISAHLDGQPVHLLLDTGAPMCNVDTSFSSEPIGQIVTQPLLLATRHLQVQWRVKDLALQRRSLGAVGTLGNNLLREYALHVNPREQTITLA